MDGNGIFSSEIILTNDISDAYSVCAVDLDGDFDNDIIATSMLGEKQIWFENLDGNGTFSSEILISNTISGHNCYPIDMDNDNDIDLVFSCFYEDKTVWFDNLDGNGTFSDEKIISLQSDNVKSVFMADINGDGTQDAITANAGDNKITWFENLLTISAIDENELMGANTAHIEIYPNPTTGLLYFNIEDHVKDVSITDITGKSIPFSYFVTNSTHHILDLSDQGNGIYFVKIQNENSTFVKKIIKN